MSYVNLQVRLFEADNVIEFHYGPSDIASEITDFEPQISGLLLEVDVLSEYYDGSIYAIERQTRLTPTLTPFDGLDALVLRSRLDLLSLRRHGLPVWPYRCDAQS